MSSYSIGSECNVTLSESDISGSFVHVPRKVLERTFGAKGFLKDEDGHERKSTVVVGF